ncbi:MAG: hypothetical protein K1X64_22285 [Myxococcaceae bacterium]|nr:hypothetical protein [Myxococcaceae bacterium]
MRRWAFVLWVWVAAATAEAAETEAPAVSEARSLMAAVKYKEAAKVLALALAKGETDAETTQRLFELSGIVAGTLNRPEQARDFFLRLLSVNPEARLTKRYPPRVMTPFFEAKASAEKNLGLGFNVMPARVKEGRVTHLMVELQRDPLAMARTVRLYWRDGADEWQGLERPASLGVLAFEVSGTEVQWHAVLVGENGVALVTLASRDMPLIARP